MYLSKCTSKIRCLDVLSFVLDLPQNFTTDCSLCVDCLEDNFKGIPFNKVMALGFCPLLWHLLSCRVALLSNGRVLFQYYFHFVKVFFHPICLFAVQVYCLLNLFKYIFYIDFSKEKNYVLAQSIFCV